MVQQNRKLHVYPSLQQGGWVEDANPLPSVIRQLARQIPHGAYPQASVWPMITTLIRWRCRAVPRRQSVPSPASPTPTAGRGTFPGGQTGRRRDGRAANQRRLAADLVPLHFWSP